MEVLTKISGMINLPFMLIGGLVGPQNSQLDAKWWLIKSGLGIVFSVGIAYVLLGLLSQDYQASLWASLGLANLAFYLCIALINWVDYGLYGTTKRQLNNILFSDTVMLIPYLIIASLSLVDFLLGQQVPISYVQSILGFLIGFQISPMLPLFM